MFKLLILSKYGEMLVGEKIGNDIAIIMEKWKRFVDKPNFPDTDKIISFFPEHPIPTIPNLIEHKVYLKLEDIAYMIRIEVSALELVSKPTISIARDLSNLSS